MKKSRLFCGLCFLLLLGRFGLAQSASAGAGSDAVRPREERREIPELLRGIWQGTDRLLLLADGGGGAAEFAVVLRVFYGWYSERTAEAASYREVVARERNDASAREAEDISVTCRTVFENAARSAGVYELVVKYPGGGKAVPIPVCVLDGKLYLDFVVRGSASGTDFFDGGGSASAPEGDGLYRAASNADGITVSPPRLKKEVTSYFVRGGSSYQIRYWESEMEYTYEKATFSDGDETFTVDKFLRVGDTVYQCTTGRSTKIRNVKKTASRLEGAARDDEGAIFALGPEYLVKVPNGGLHEHLQEIVDGNNRRRRDPPKPLFPPSEIDFHWKEISELEKYNPHTWNRRNIDLGK